MIVHFAQSVVQHGGSPTMPKGSAANRKLRKEVKELKELTAQLDSAKRSENALRPPIIKPNTHDWICKCNYYCYFEKDRCPLCSCSREQGKPHPGYKRRIQVDIQTGTPTAAVGVARIPGLQIPPTRRILQPPPQQPRVAQQRSYLEAARTQPVGQLRPQLQQQGLQQRIVHAPPWQQGQPLQQQVQAAGVQGSVRLEPVLIGGPKPPAVLSATSLQ